MTSNNVIFLLQEDTMSDICILSSLSRFISNCKGEMRLRRKGKEHVIERSRSDVMSLI